MNFTLLDLLFMVFLVLKLTKVIDWSWWFIVLPLLVQVLIVVVSTIAEYKDKYKWN